MPIPDSDRAGSLRLHFDFPKFKQLDEDESFASQAFCNFGGPFEVEHVIQPSNSDADTNRSSDHEVLACDAELRRPVEAEDAAYIHELLLRRALYDVADRLLGEER